MNAFILLTACVAASQAQILAAPYPYAAGLTYAHPQVVAPKVVAAPAPIVAAAPLNPSSQFQAQDEFGNLQYGYSNINSQKHEIGNTYGGVQGSYSYVDANGVVQTTNYIADGLGFRVQATNLPVAPVADLKQPIHDQEGPVFNLVAPVFDLEPAVHDAPLPVAVEDTPEVKAAKEAFQAAFDEAAARAKRSTPADTAVLPAPEPVVAPAPLTYATAPLAYPYAAGALPAAYPFAAGALPAAYPYALPAAAPAAVVASAPAARDAELHTVKLNPGHAVAYRVY